MYIKGDIAYAGDTCPVLGVASARPLEGHALKVKFTDGTQCIVDMGPLLDSPAFAPLKDKVVFDQVYVEYGVPMWNDGDIDIAPEWLQQHGQPIEQRA